MKSLEEIEARWQEKENKLAWEKYQEDRRIFLFEGNERNEPLSPNQEKCMFYHKQRFKETYCQEDILPGRADIEETEIDTKKEGPIFEQYSHKMSIKKEKETNAKLKIMENKG